MKVKFKIDVDIQDRYHIKKGQKFRAIKYRDSNEQEYLMIEMRDGCTVKAPMTEVDDILEIVE